MFRLREDGWQPGNPKDSYKRGDEQLYWQRFDRPLTYFIALYSAERVFHKGVGEIKHNQKDMYYRILLTVKAEAILGLLTDFENKPEEQIVVRIKKNKDDDGPELSDGEGEPVPEPNGIPLMNAPGPALPAILPPPVPWWETQWRRTWVLYRGTRAKVWFDNCCSNTSQRRGWSNCTVHGCGRIRPVWGTRNEFAVGMILWVRYGIDNPDISKQDHLRWVPDMDSVQAALPEASFEDF